MTGSADTVGPHAVGAICGHTVHTNTVSTTFGHTVRTNAIGTICGYAVRTNAIGATFGYTVGTNTVGATFGYAVGTNAIGTIFGYTVGTNAVSTTFSYTVHTDAVSTTFGYTVRTNTVGAIFNNAEALQGTLIATFGDAIGAYTISAIFSDDRGSGLFGGNLRQSESTGGQSGDNEAGEDLLFHGRSPKEGVSNWLRGSCYARPKTAKGTSRDSDNQCHRYLEKRLSIRQIVITTSLSVSPSPSVHSISQRVNGTGICIKNQ